MEFEEALRNFSAPTFRQYQKEILQQITEAFNKGVRCILLEAPPGFGKSPLCVDLCRTCKNAFYITPQLTLISQLINDPFTGPFLSEIKGRQNYFCAEINPDNPDENTTVDIGLCERYPSFRHKCKSGELQDQLKWTVCPYWIHKHKAMNAHTALMSFAYFVIEHSYGETSFPLRELLVIDEAHNISNEITNHVSLTISPYTLPIRLYEQHETKIKTVKSLEQGVDVVLSISSDCEEELSNKPHEIPSKEEIIRYNKLESFLSTSNAFIASVEKESEWIYQFDLVQYRNAHYKKLVFQPLYARDFAYRKLWDKAKYFIMSSATIPATFIHEVGLDLAMSPEEILRIRVPSTFPIENRPIIDSTVGKLIFTKKQETLPKAVKRLEEILDLEAGKSIAVHCNSYDMSKYIQEHIDPKFRTLLIFHNSQNRQEQLETWKSNKGSIFLAVGFTEGQDWIGDICEAQILFKVPYPNMQDQRVKTRIEKYHEWKWYNNEALKTVIQAYGRAIRTPTDKANFYVIDSSFMDLVQSCCRDIPDFFSDAFPRNIRLLWKLAKSSPRREDLEAQ